MSYASKGVEVRVAYLNLDPGATCKVSDGAASGRKQEMLSMGQKIRNSWSGGRGCSYADEGRGDNGIQRASKKFNISRSREFIATICHSFLRPMLELRISGACKVALPEASSAVTPSVPKAVIAFLGWSEVIPWTWLACKISLRTSNFDDLWCFFFMVLQT